MTSPWLTEAEENALHADRLLAIEQRPFQRVFKRLTNPDAVILRPHLPTPPPDAGDEIGDADQENKEARLARLQKDREQWREDMLLDFAALQSSMIRIQLLQVSNQRERERYAAERLRIQSTAENIRQGNVQLKARLEQARQTMETRKRYDELANRILGNKLLKSREEQVQMHEKLQKEIAEQEAESEEYARAVEARRRAWESAIKPALIGLKSVLHPELQQQDEEMRDGEAEGEDESEGAARREGSRSVSSVASPSGSRGDSPLPGESEEVIEEGAEPTLKAPPSQASTRATGMRGQKADLESEEVAVTTMDELEEGEADEDEMMED